MERKNFHLCDTVDITQQKKVTKTEAFENALQSGYLHKWRLLKTLWFSVNRAKIDKKKAAVATTQNTYSMAPLQCDLTKVQQCEQIKAIKQIVFLSCL